MRSQARLSCVLVGESNLLVRCAEIFTGRGHHIAAVVTTDGTITDGPNVYRSMADARRSLTDRPDLVLSIVNRTVLSVDDLAFPKLASINYHDSPLPAYAGVNAPSWAILHGESEHGVTWHLMAGAVDSGDILVQRRFAIAEEETALSLSAKCFEHAVDSFGELLDQVEAGNLDGTAQDKTKRTVFAKAQRLPRQGIIRWTDPGAGISRFIRAAQLGPYENDFGLPKILLADGSVVIVGKADVMREHTTSAAGTVIDVGRHDLLIAAGDGVLLRLEGLTATDGRNFEPSSALRGTVLPLLSPEQEQAIEAVTATAAKQEDNLCATLGDLPAPLRPEGLRPCKYEETSEHVFEFEVDPASTPGKVFAPILARLAEQNHSRPFAVAIAQEVPPAFMTRRPFVCQGSETTALSEAIDHAITAPPIPADLPLRFPVLRPSLLRLESISVCFSAEAASPASNPGLVVWLNNGNLSLRFDASQVHAREAGAMAEALMGRDSAQAKNRVAFRSVHQWIAEHAASLPDAIAVEHGTEKLTYNELCKRANALATVLQEHGARKESIYAILLPQGTDFITAMLGILRSGAAYLPLEPATPLHRLREIVRDARPFGVITNAAHADLAAQLGVPVIRNGGQASPKQPSANSEAHPEDLAYVIYTSGSTGEPKGSMIEHGALARFIAEDIARNAIGPGDRVLQLCSTAFDASVEEICSALCAGATLVVRPANLLDSATTFLDFCDKERLTIIGIYASMLGDVLATMEKRGSFPSAVRLATTGGEAVNATDAERWRQFFATRGTQAPKLLNVYGLTETTVANCCSDLSREPDLPGQVPIGRPLPGNRIKVVDRNLAEVAPGQVGELLIAGPQLARAYWNRPALNTARFFRDRADGTRWFRTGDLVRVSPAAQLYFEGRIDRQVKVSGVRIELEDIERAMQSHPEATHAAAILHRMPGRGEILVGCFSPAKDGLEENLRRHLEQRLPATMRPRRLVPIDNFPLNDRGKTDLAALAKQLDRYIGADDRNAGQPEDAASRVWKEFFPWSNANNAEESFFELGGDSLTAVRLLFRAEQETGVHLPVSSFFRDPNLGGLRCMLLAGRNDPAFDPLLALQSHGEGTPIYILHGGDGDVAGYSVILNHLGEERPVYGVRSAAVLRGRGLPGSFEEAAADVTASILEHRPQGDWILFGYSWAGTLAYETAVQLHAKTGRMPVVVMLDALAPLHQITRGERAVHFVRRFPRWVVRSWFGTRLLRFTRSFLLKLSPETRTALRERAETTMKRMPNSVARSPLGAKLMRYADDAMARLANPRRIGAPVVGADPTEHFFTLARRYNPSRQRGLEIHLIRADKHEISPFHHDVHFGWKDNGWRKTTGCVVHSHEIRSCNHNELLREPKCADVAHWVRRISQEADRNWGTKR